MKRFFIREAAVRGAAVLGVAAALLTTAGVTTSAQAASAGAAATSHSRASHLSAYPVAAPNGAGIAASCPTPAHDFCVFQDVHCSVNEYVVPTADHSAWFNFGAVGVPYHPRCILNASNSSVWAEDEATEHADCAAPGQGFSSSNEQYGWFYVKYNVGTCGSEPGGE